MESSDRRHREPLRCPHQGRHEEWQEFDHHLCGPRGGQILAILHVAHGRAISEALWALSDSALKGVQAQAVFTVSLTSIERTALPPCRA